ncbi:hypothetical protein KFK09_028380 [Dendrobium nobile]|uniref:Uncharacterized protein n=1 Tax=Dendrobium nobile TaxID=94219 RepID=A0A8T3A1S8_DENNO|nr:hypothetical protein KFK09_028380 [Dendrobium nobile]
MSKFYFKIIRKVYSNFIFHGDSSSRKIHIIVWNKVYQHRVNGGLDIFDLEVLNFAFRCSLIWELLMISCSWLFRLSLSIYLFGSLGYILFPCFGKISLLLQETLNARFILIFFLIVLSLFIGTLGVWGSLFMRLLLP